MKNQQNLEVITFLKGYAIFTIVVFHLFQNAGLPAGVEKALSFGGTGVHTFFLLSGFGLYLSHLRRPLGIGSFIRKRFSKIYIPYVGIVLFSALLSELIPIYEQDGYALLGHVLLYKMFDDRIIGSYGYHLWFISTIIQFYLVFPVLVWMKERMASPFFMLVVGLLSGIWVAVVLALGKEEVRAWYSFFLQYVWEFGAGMVLAERYAQRGTWRLPGWGRLAAWALFGLLSYSLMTLYWGTIGQMVNDVPALIGYTAVGLLLYRLPRGWIHRFLLFTGAVSYALYLVHIAVKLTIKSVLPSFGWPMDLLILPLILGVSYLVAYVYHQRVVSLDFSLRLKAEKPRIKSV